MASNEGVIVPKTVEAAANLLSAFILALENEAKKGNRIQPEQMEAVGTIFGGIVEALPVHALVRPFSKEALQ